MAIREWTFLNERGWEARQTEDELGVRGKKKGNIFGSYAVAETRDTGKKTELGGKADCKEVPMGKRKKKRTGGSGGTCL